MEISKELAKELLGAIKSGKELVGNAKDFTLEQAPEVIQQLITYKLVENGLYFLVPFFFCILFFVLTRKCWKWAIKEINGDKEIKNKKECEATFFGAFVVFNSVSFLISFYIASGYLVEFIKVWLAPKIFLIEYLSQIVKG